jgi:hypothetical protein
MLENNIEVISSENIVSFQNKLSLFPLPENNEKINVRNIINPNKKTHFV